MKDKTDLSMDFPISKGVHTMKRCCISLTFFNTYVSKILWKRKYYEIGIELKK